MLEKYLIMGNEVIYMSYTKHKITKKFIKQNVIIINSFFFNFTCLILTMVFIIS